ncbi:uncharacterized protein LOC127123004 [Lathyrus oleraceus]|uniref:uncharacterized protein LOC127123004 n=1 Tax=Pisum sativum TaxID=3888 RepID=UPI0021CE9F29|nr:uncharacterized protein LOC127123004 [Pisum sativum]
MAQSVMSVPPPVVHVAPYVKEPIFHADQSETVGVYERMNEFQDLFQAMQKENQDLRGKDLFGKNSHDICLVPNVKIPHKFKVPNFEKCAVVKRDLQEMLDQNLIQITRDGDEDEHEVNVIVPRFNLPEPVVIAYNEVPIPSFSSVVNIVDISDVTQNGRVFIVAALKRIEYVVIKKPTQEKTHVMQTGQSSIVNPSSDQDEGLELIKKSDFNMVDQLLHTPSKISVLSLLMSLEAHREALQKVLKQAYVDHDVTIDQFDGIMDNITACNNLSFSDEELPEQGKNHNFSLHISMNCQEDAMFNVLVETGSSLNVLSKTTLSKLSYHSTLMRFSGVVVKAFDGSRKTVIGEVDRPMKIGSCLFQIMFQVMDISLTYSCLLGCTWIHEAGAVTSTLHQKLKFMKNGMLVIVSGEQATLVSHLSSFSYINVDEAMGMLFQALSFNDIAARKNGESMASLKDAQHMVENGQSTKWGQVVNLAENKNKADFGFSPGTTQRDLKRI